MASIIEHTLSFLKTLNPDITEVFLRSDNAGCYHCAYLLLSLPSLGERVGVKISRYDYSEPQAGKDICDRRIAAVKSHMRRYINEGNDVKSAEDMKKAIESYGGVKGCYAAVCEVKLSAQTMTKHTMQGIQSLHNFSYEARGMRAWHAYNVGPGKFFDGKKLARFGTPQGPTKMQIKQTFSQPSVPTGVYLARAATTRSPADQLGPSQLPRFDQGSMEENDPLQFLCPEEGCIKMYRSFAALQKHLDIGKHIVKLERESVYDDIKRKWADTCITVSGSYIHAEPSTSAVENTGASIPETREEEGWALRKTRKSVVFSEKAKNYLRGVFFKGEETGKKANGSEVATRMRTLRSANGEKMFGKTDWLTEQQITRYFSRLSALNKSGQLQHEEIAGQVSDEEGDDVDDLVAEVDMVRTRRQIRRDLEL